MARLPVKGSLHVAEQRGQASRACLAVHEVVHVQDASGHRRVNMRWPRGEEDDLHRGMRLTSCIRGHHWRLDSSGCRSERGCMWTAADWCASAVWQCCCTHAVLALQGVWGGGPTSLKMACTRHSRQQHCLGASLQLPVQHCGSAQSAPSAAGRGRKICTASSASLTEGTPGPSHSRWPGAGPRRPAAQERPRWAGCRTGLSCSRAFSQERPAQASREHCSGLWF